MLYGILFFLAALAVIILSRVTVAKIEGASSKLPKNRWIWGISCLASLTIGVLLPVAWLIAKVILIVYAAFAAMVFFELNRRYVESSVATSSELLTQKVAEIKANKPSATKKPSAVK
jgi:hypothetical protein